MSGRTSLIIPGRCEPYFQKTVDSALESATGDIEIIAVVDGPGQKPPVISSDPRVKVIVLDKSIGQRGAYNLGVRESTGQYVMKIDAHALLSKGFDEELANHCPDRTVVLPEMRRLDVHQWQDKPTGKTHFMHFGLDLYCHFWKDYKKRPDAQGNYPEVMSGQGSCWFTTREWNDHIGLLDEKVGSWGNVGIEVSLRTWLCGGSQIVNKNAWQAHWFRRDEGGFTYPMDGRKVAKAHNYTRSNYYFKDDAFPNQVRPFSWLIKKFNPPGWESYLVDDEHKSPRYMIYYTDGRLDTTDSQLANAVRKNLANICGLMKIISVSQTPLNFGRNICVGEKPYCYRSMYEQLLAGLKAVPENAVVYPVEHDVFYHPSHFAKLPDDDKQCFINTNRYYWRSGLPYFFKARGEKTMSHVVCYRDVLIDHCEKRIAQWEAGDPAADHIQIDYTTWESDKPNVDIRHGSNLTPDGKWKNEFLKGRKTGVVNLPGWGNPIHFSKKVKYGKADMDIVRELADPRKQAETIIENPTRWICKRWKLENQVAPIRVPTWKRERMAQLFAQCGYRKGAEVGVREGKFSEVLCKSIHGLELLCVDRWDVYPGHSDLDRLPEPMMFLDEAKQRLSSYNVRFIRASSMDAVRDVPDESLDFVYIDANHTFDFVMQDIIEWSKKVRPGGMVSGHDYFRCRNFGVVPAVDTYTREHLIHEWFITDERKPSFFWRKP